MINNKFKGMEKYEFLLQNSTLHNEVRMNVDLIAIEVPDQHKPANAITLSFRNTSMAIGQPTILSMDSHLNYALTNKTEVASLIEALKKLKNKL